MSLLITLFLLNVQYLKKKVLSFVRVIRIIVGMNSVKIFSKSQFSILWCLAHFQVLEIGELYLLQLLWQLLWFKKWNSEITAVIPVIARIIPALLSTFAGLLADRFNKKNIMLLCDSVRMLVVVLLFFAESLLQLFIINFCFRDIFINKTTIKRSCVVPEVVKDDI